MQTINKLINSRRIYFKVRLQLQLTQPSQRQITTQTKINNNLAKDKIAMSSQSHPILPQSKEQKQLLKKQIVQFIQHLNDSIEQQKKLLSSSLPSKQVNSMLEKVDILNQRLKLIDKSQQFSLHRLNHLEQIFKYYCTHIFKIGKHMTFDRLEYEKQHLNSERFFLFLKDFGLIITQIQGKPKQIVSKQALMTIFKKISSNSRDLNFQQFIKCLQKVGMLYYDEKSNYWNKIQEQKLQRIRRRKQIQRRKVKRMKINGQKVDQKIEQQILKLQEQQKQFGISDNKKLESQQNEHNQGQKQQVNQNQQKQGRNSNTNIINQESNERSNQNDDLIREMMQNKDLEDPNQQINQLANQNKMQLEKKSKVQKNHQTKLLTLTNNQKIQYFYQLIGVDSVKDYKNKMTVLNMTAFKGKKDNAQKQVYKQNKTINEGDSFKNQVDRNNSLEDQQRLHKLKQKMSEKREKRRNQPIPKPKELKQSQTARMRRQMKEQREFRTAEKLKEKQLQNDAIKQKTKDEKKVGKSPKNEQNVTLPERLNFNEKQVNWAMLQKMSFDQLKLRQFNPTRLYHLDEDDHIFMQQYTTSIKPADRTSRMEVRERHSLSIVQNVRKRADEVQKSERNQEKMLNHKVTQSGRGSIKGKF